VAARVGPPLVFAFAVLVVWQLAVTLSGVSPETLPKPSRIAAALYDDRSLLADNAWVTLSEILLGYAAAVVIGVGLALLVSSSRTIERALYPWLVVSQMIPVLAIAPILVLWTGLDIRPKLIVIALVSFFPIAVNTIDGLKATDPELLDLLRTLGAGRWRRFRLARLPGALPYTFSGLRIAAALAVIGAVFAEWVGASSTLGGLGSLILTFNNQTATTEMFATITVLAAIGVALFFAVGLLERIAMPWWRDSRRDPRVDGPG
jgi:ABC-type nitrate/sulfonate/bicarbonate transport system permease component